MSESMSIHLTSAHTQEWLHQDQKMALKFAYQKVAVVLGKNNLGVNQW